MGSSETSVHAVVSDNESQDTIDRFHDSLQVHTSIPFFSIFHFAQEVFFFFFLCNFHFYHLNLIIFVVAGAPTVAFPASQCCGLLRNLFLEHQTEESVSSSSRINDISFTIQHQAILVKVRYRIGLPNGNWFKYPQDGLRFYTTLHLSQSKIWERIT